MKKLTSLILMFALFAGVACTTDATEDLAINLGSKGTVLTVSLDGSRIALGDKVGNEYEARWSEGDKISINGITSGAAAIDATDLAKATFSFEETLKAPYNVVYPAAAAADKVTFAAEQSFVNGTFSAGATPMYGYSESGEGITLRHLTGVLKIGVKGSVTLVAAQVSTLDRAPIAGTFDINCSTGEVVATEGAAKVVSYSFGEGLALSDEAQFIHVAVPAGVYNELYVTLYDSEGGVMYATVKATDEKPLNAGAVREFTNAITYAATDKVFIIKDVASLKKFAEEAASLDMDAVFVKDVDMSAEEWTPIDGFTKTLLGNGYAIKGLKAPLFGTTSASVKGLHMEEFVYTTNDIPAAGAIACKIVATDDLVPTISNCSVSGTITIENTTLAPEAANTETALTYGAIVGASEGGVIDGCVNNATFEIKQSVSTAATVKQTLRLGGIVGLIDIFTKSDETIAYPIIRNSTNRGAININDTSRGTENNTAIAYYIGGIFGAANKSVTVPAEMSNCVNDAPITSTNYNAYGSNYSMIGGLVGYVIWGMKGADCSNTKNGKISLYGHGNHLYLGGLIAYGYNGDWDNLTNYADLDIQVVCKSYSDEGNINSNFFVAGCLGSPGLNDTNGSHKYTADNVVNYGNIKVVGSAKSVKIGGTLGRASQGTLNNCANHGDLDIKLCSTEPMNLIIGGFESEGVGDGDSGPANNCANYGSVTVDLDGSTSIGQIHLAGLSAYCHHPLDGCVNGKDAVTTLKGAFTTTTNNNLEGDKTTDSHYVMGNISGYKASKGCTNTTNEGTFIIDATITSAADKNPFFQIGGFAGRTHQAIGKTNVQKGKVVVKGNTVNNTGWLSIGGLVGSYIYANSGYTNAGNIYLSGKHNKVYVGGLAGYGHRYSQIAKMQDANNSGNIYVGYDENGNEAETVFYACPEVAGLVAHALSTLTECSNSGNIYYNATLDTSVTSSQIHLAGCIAQGRTYDSAGKEAAIDMTLVDVSNSGDIFVKAHTGARELYVGGVSGYLYGKGTQKNLTNTGNISVEIVGGTSYVKIGGIATYIRNVISDMTNSGNITLTGSTGSSLYIGGVVSQPNGYHRTNLTNNGDILVDGAVGNDCFIGGICYDGNHGSAITYANCHNTGNIELTKNSTIKNGVGIGGIIGKFTNEDIRKTFDACSNSGDITIAGLCRGTVRVGGFMGYHTNSTLIVKNGFTNSGNITFSGNTDGADNVQIGGLFGYTQNGFLSYDSTTTSTDEEGNETSTTTTIGWSGTILNSGTITMSGYSKGGKVRVAGFSGYSNVSFDSPDATYINTGDIIFTGSAGEKNGVAGESSISGIIGNVEDKCIVNNATAFCNIIAIDADYAGMILATPRAEGTILATNCKVGGKIATAMGANTDGDIYYDYVVLNESNYFDYIYGIVSPDWGTSTNYDGCTFISSLE